MFALYLLGPLVSCDVARLAEAIDTNGLMWGNILRIAAFFSAGAMIREWRVPVRGTWALIASSTLAIVMVLAPEVTWFVADLAIPDVLITLSSQPFPVLRSLGRFGDPSCGMIPVVFSCSSC